MCVWLVWVCVWVLLGTITHYLCICYLAIKLYCIVLYCSVLYRIVCVTRQHLECNAVRRPMTATCAWSGNTAGFHRWNKTHDCSISVNCRHFKSPWSGGGQWLQHPHELSRRGVHIWDNRTMTAAYEWTVMAWSSYLGQQNNEWCMWMNCLWHGAHI